MSDEVLRIVPTDPNWQPDDETAVAVTALIRALTLVDGDGGWTDTRFADQPELIDCGENFQGIRCPACGADLGMDWFDSLGHAFGTIATGGFGLRNTSVEYYKDWRIELWIGAFLLISGVNYGLLYLTLVGQPLQVLALVVAVARQEPLVSVEQFRRHAPILPDPDRPAPARRAAPFTPLNRRCWTRAGPGAGAARSRAPPSRARCPAAPACVRPRRRP